MTQTQLEHAVADRTGESPRTIHRLGFGLLPEAPHLESEDLRLVVDCPFCGRPVEYPGLVGKGTPALAECSNPRCDVYFDFAVDDDYVLRS